MKNHLEILERVNYLLNRINQHSKIPRDYGSGHLLYQSEIHTIEAIKNHENVNATELSNILGITNGAVTQIVSKLKKKFLVEQYHTANNRKEVYYQLTTAGLIANSGHEKYHEKTYEKLSEYMDTLDEDQINTIRIFFNKLTCNLPLE